MIDFKVVVKYVFFFTAVVGIAPATFLLCCYPRNIRWFALFLVLPMLRFNSTAINFFSKETYRGTARGMEISMIYLIALTILLTYHYLLKPIYIFPGWGGRIYFLYFLFSNLSIVNAYILGYSYLELWKMIMMYLVFLAVYHYLKYSNGDFDTLLYGISIVIIFNFLAVIQQHFSGIYQVRGYFPHQNSLAMFMMMVGVLFFSRYFNNREGRRSKYFLFVFLMASAILVRTYSRGALLCYPIACFLTLVCSFRKSVSFRKMSITVFLFIVAIIGFALFIPRIIERFKKAPEASANTRVELAIAAVNMIKDKPYLGVGINNWGLKINPPFEYAEHRRNAQSGRGDDEFKDGIVETVYLLVAAECGIPCFIIMLIWFGFYWISTIRLMMAYKKTDFYYIPAGIFGGLTGVFLQSALEWVLKQQMNYMLLMIFFAFISYMNINKHTLFQRNELQEEGVEVEPSY